MASAHRLGGVFTVIALGAAAISPAGALGKGVQKVPGAKYAVTFAGKASADATYFVPGGGARPDGSGHQSGTWNAVDDNPTLVWLPFKYKGYNKRALGSGGVALTIGNAGEPASVNETGTGEDPNTGDPVNYSCHSSVVYEVGTGFTGVSVIGGHGIDLSTSFSYGSNGREFTTSLGGSDAFTCNVAGHAPFTYPVAPTGSTVEEHLGYRGVIPFAKVGHAKFTVSASDDSRLTTSGACEGSGAKTEGGSCTGPNFQISGTYTLTKRCTGVISSSAFKVDTGKCNKGKKKKATKKH